MGIGTFMSLPTQIFYDSTILWNLHSNPTSQETVSQKQNSSSGEVAARRRLWCFPRQVFKQGSCWTRGERELRGAQSPPARLSTQHLPAPPGAPQHLSPPGMSLSGLLFSISVMEQSIDWNTPSSVSAEDLNHRSWLAAGFASAIGFFLYVFLLSFPGGK